MKDCTPPRPYGSKKNYRGLPILGIVSVFYCFVWLLLNLLVSYDIYIYIYILLSQVDHVGCLSPWFCLYLARSCPLNVHNTISAQIGLFVVVVAWQTDFALLAVFFWGGPPASSPWTRSVTEARDKSLSSNRGGSRAVLSAVMPSHPIPCRCFGGLVFYRF